MAGTGVHESRTNVVLVATIVTTVVAILLTCLRLYVRLFMIKLLDWDDLFNILGMLTQVVVMALVLVAVQNGLGQHFEDVDQAQAVYGIQMLRIAEFILILSTVFIKISICLFLIRLFVRNRSWRFFLWTFIAFNSLTSFLDASLIFPQCTPVSFNWDKSVDGKCWSDAAIDGIGIMQGSIAAFTDFTLATLPIYFLWDIRILWRVKIAICSIMALGYASGAFAIARTVLVPSLTTTHDPTWDLVPLFTWAILESNFGVIAAAAPSVRPLLGGKDLSTAYSQSEERRTTVRRTHDLAHSAPWLQIRDTSQAKNIYHDRDEVGIDGGMEMLAYNTNEIVRTTNVVIRSEQRHVVRGQRSRDSDDESLVSEAASSVGKT